MIRFRKGVLALVASLFIPVAAFAQEMDEMGPPAEMKQIADQAGTWDVAFSYRLDPGAPWQTTQGAATISNLLDGAIQQTEFECVMMGMTLKGLGITSYDRNIKKWQNMWTDNLGARLSMYEGEWKDSTFVFAGAETLYGMKIHNRNTIFNLSADRFEWKMEQSMDGKTFNEVATAVYTRKKEKTK